MKLKGAIFDLDGTLLDSMSIWDTIGEEYLRAIGYELPEHLNEVLKNMSLRQAAVYYRERCGVTLSVEQIMAGVNSMIAHYYRYEVLPKPGAVGFLRELRRNGVKMCIATATDLPLAEAALTRCGMRDCFSGILTCTGVGCGKDEPLIFREALAHLGTVRTDTAVFEDALYAAETAKRDGFITVAVYDSHEAGQEKIRSLADFYLFDYRNLDSFWGFASAL